MYLPIIFSIYIPNYKPRTRNYSSHLHEGCDPPNISYFLTILNLSIFDLDLEKYKKTFLLS
jgi:hypothetical protein